MAREAKITQNEVSDTADRIRATGVKPTARAIREALGMGSMATVLKYLQVWQSNQTPPSEAPAILPPSLQKALADFIGQEVASARAALEADLVTAQQENGDLIAESERQSSTIEDQAQQLKTLESDKAALSGRLTELASSLEKIQLKEEQQRQAAENARTELAKLQVRLEALPLLEAEMERLRETVEAERVTRIKAEKAVAIASAKLDKTEAQVNDLKAWLTQAENEVREARRR